MDKVKFQKNVAVFGLISLLSLLTFLAIQNKNLFTTFIRSASEKELVQQISDAKESISIAGLKWFSEKEIQALLAASNQGVEIVLTLPQKRLGSFFWQAHDVRFRLNGLQVNYSDIELPKTVRIDRPLPKLTQQAGELKNDLASSFSVRDVKKAKKLYEQYVVAFKAGDYKKALPNLTLLAELDAISSHDKIFIHSRRAKVEELLRNYDSALRCLKAAQNLAAEDAPLYPEVQLALGELLLERLDPDKGVSTLKMLSTKFEDARAGQRALLLLGRHYSKEKQYAKAHEYYSAYLETPQGNKLHVGVYPETINLLLLEGKGDEAIQKGKAYWAKYKDHADSQGRRIARYFRDAGDPESALWFAAEAQQASGLEGQKSALLTGRLYAALRNKNAAREAYRNALDNYPLSEKSLTAYRKLFEMSKGEKELPALPEAKEPKFWKGKLTLLYARKAQQLGQYQQSLDALRSTKPKSKELKLEKAELIVQAHIKLATIGALVRSEEKALQHLSLALYQIPPNRHTSTALKQLLQLSLPETSISNIHRHIVAQSGVKSPLTPPLIEAWASYLKECGDDIRMNNLLTAVAQSPDSLTIKTAILLLERHGGRSPLSSALITWEKNTLELALNLDEQAQKDLFNWVKTLSRIGYSSRGATVTSQLSYLEPSQSKELAYIQWQAQWETGERAEAYNTGLEILKNKDKNSANVLFKLASYDMSQNRLVEAVSLLRGKSISKTHKKQLKADIIHYTDHWLDIFGDEEFRNITHLLNALYPHRRWDTGLTKTIINKLTTRSRTSMLYYIVLNYSSKIGPTGKSQLSGIIQLAQNEGEWRVVEEIGNLFSKYYSNEKNEDSTSRILIQAKLSQLDAVGAWRQAEEMLFRKPPESGMDYALDISSLFLKHTSPAIKKISAFILTNARNEADEHAANNNLGNYYHAIQDYEHAVLHLHQAFASSSHLSRRKQLKVGLKLLDASLKEEIESPYTDKVLKNLRELLNKEMNAQSYAKIGHNLGVMLRNAGRHDDAIMVFENVTSFAGEAANGKSALYNIGKTYEAMGQYEKAIEAYSEHIGTANSSTFLDEKISLYAIANALTLSQEISNRTLSYDLRVKAEAMLNGVQDPFVALEIAQYFGRQGFEDLQSRIFERAYKVAIDEVENASDHKVSQKNLANVVKRLYKMGFYKEADDLASQYEALAFADNPDLQTEALYEAQYERIRALIELRQVNQVVKLLNKLIPKVQKNGFSNAEVKLLYLHSKFSFNQKERWDIQEELVSKFPASTYALEAKIRLGAKAFQDGHLSKASQYGLNALEQSSTPYFQEYGKRHYYNALFLNSIISEEQGNHDRASSFREKMNAQSKEKDLYVSKILEGT